MRAIAVWLFIAVIALSALSVPVRANAEADSETETDAMAVAPAAPPRGRTPAQKGAQKAGKAQKATTKGDASRNKAAKAKNPISKAVHNKKAAGHFGTAAKNWKASKKTQDPNSQTAAHAHTQQKLAEAKKANAKIDAKRALGPQKGARAAELDRKATKAKMANTEKASRSEIEGRAKQNGWISKSASDAASKGSKLKKDTKNPQNPFKRRARARKGEKLFRKAETNYNKVADSLPKGSTARAKNRAEAHRSAAERADSTQTRLTSNLPLPSAYRGGGVKGVAASASRGLHAVVTAPSKLAPAVANARAKRSMNKYSRKLFADDEAAKANANANPAQVNGAAPA